MLNDVELADIESAPKPFLLILLGQAEQHIQHIDNLLANAIALNVAEAKSSRVRSVGIRDKCREILKGA